MKESCGEGLASHTGREFCLDEPVRAWGSVNSGKHRRAIELRKHQLPEAELVAWREGNTGHSVKRAVSCSGGGKELGMCGHSPRENRDTSGRSLCRLETAQAEATGKVNSRTPVVEFPRRVGRQHSTWEVGEQRGRRPRAEPMEERMPTEGNLAQEATYRTQGRQCVSIGLGQVR